MERFYLAEAEVCVGNTKYGEWFRLGDFADRQEFLSACDRYFSEGKDVSFLAWENIPDELISARSISENLFTLRDALEAMDDDEQEGFFAWCKYHAYDISQEDTYSLVSRFKEWCGHLYSSDRCSISELLATGQHIFTEDYG